MRRFLAVATAVGLAVGAGALTANAHATEVRALPGRAPALTWGTCASAALAVRGAECGFLTVPMDHAKPGGRKIKLAVSRIKHTTAVSQGVMLVNPGGPGAPGLSLAALGDFVPDQVGRAYDWIGFDPRGVGTSVPALTCDAKYSGFGRPPFVPSTKAIEKAWLARTAGYAKKCDKAGGALLDHLKTVDTVRDMESLRKALGEEKINFYGLSYGTYLGQVYATLHPERVRRMVLDGNVDPGRVWYRSNLDQNVAFDRNIKIYFGWLAKHDAVYHLGRTAAAVEKLYYATQTQLAKKPAGGVLGPDELTEVFVQSGYYVFGWAGVAEAFSALITKKDPKPLRALFDKANPQTAGADNGNAIYLAVQCSDAKWPTSWRTWKKDNWRVHRIAPFETWANAWLNAPCRTWGAKAGRPVQVTGAKAPPVLLISESRDAATPYSGSLEVRKRFPRSALIEGVGGTTHAASLFGNSCVDDAVAAYLKSGVLPKRVKANTSDKKCAPIAQPAPVATTAVVPAPASVPVPAPAPALERRPLSPLSRAALQTVTAAR